VPDIHQQGSDQSVTKFSIGRSHPVVLPLDSPPTGKESKPLRSVSSDDERAPATSKPHSAGRTVWGFEGRDILNIE
jgi:hypothetical protein